MTEAVKSVNEEQKSPWLSTGFFTSGLIIIGGLFIGFQEQYATEVIGVGIGGIAAFKMIRDWVKQGLKVDFRQAVTNGNWWQNISVVVLGFLPTFPLEGISSLEQIARQLIDGNWQGAAFSSIGLITVIYQVYFKKNVDEWMAKAQPAQ